VATPIPRNQAQFTLAEVLAATQGVVEGNHPNTAPFCGVSTDTRNLGPGSIFVALPGERFDGHDFAAQAVALGARLLIVERALDINVQQVVVPDSLSALGALAALHRERWAGAVVAIAGAAGKTTTRCALSALLGHVAGSAVHSTAGNLNNRIGVPMVLLALRAEHRFAVVEVGTNQLGEVPVLTAMVRPDVSVLTLVDLEHTEGLTSLDAIELEEGAIFAHSCHSLVANADDDRAARQALTAADRSRTVENGPQRVLTYGVSSSAHTRLLERETLSAYASRLTLQRNGETPFVVTLRLVGAPAAYAVMAAVTATEALIGRKLAVDEIQRGLERDEFSPEGRVEMVDGPLGALIINDSYNANPASMQRALETATELVRLRAGRLHLVLGEMRELGVLSDAAHRTLAHQVSAVPWDSLFAIGREMLPLMQELTSLGWAGERQPSASKRVCKHSLDTSGVAQQLSQLLGPDDVILVKGSRGVRTEKVIAELVPKVNPT
jgi:UDP-N-acetylmuramoyl-tripeptide--D-alanyl-D-alanine ligase